MGIEDYDETEVNEAEAAELAAAIFKKIQQGKANQTLSNIRDISGVVWAETEGLSRVQRHAVFELLIPEVAKLHFSPNEDGAEAIKWKSGMLIASGPDNLLENFSSADTKDARGFIMKIVAHHDQYNKRQLQVDIRDKAQARKRRKN